MPFYICPNCKDRSIDIDGFEGMSREAVACHRCGFGFLFELMDDYYPGPNTGLVVCDQEGRILASGRGVFELTGYNESELMGHPVGDAVRPVRIRGGQESGRAGARMGRAPARRATRVAHEGGSREARDRRPVPRLRRRRRPAGRAQPAVLTNLRTRGAGSSSSNPARSSARTDGSLSGSVCARTLSTAGWASAHSDSAGDRLGRVALPPCGGNDRVADRHGAALRRSDEADLPHHHAVVADARRSGTRSPARRAAGRGRPRPSCPASDTRPRTPTRPAAPRRGAPRPPRR